MGMRCSWIDASTWCVSPLSMGWVTAALRTTLQRPRAGICASTGRMIRLQPSSVFMTGFGDQLGRLPASACMTL